VFSPRWRRQQAAPTSSLMDLLVPGCRVLLTDLVSRSDLNGEEALLLLWIDDRQRRAVCGS
jgi:hypothetical protein